MIRRNQQPAIIRTRLQALLQPMEASLHGRSHIGGRFRKTMRQGTGSFRQDSDFGDMGAGDDENMLHIGLSKRGEDVFENGSVAERQSELGTSHAAAVTGCGEDGECHGRIVSACTRPRGRSSVVPRLRQAINSATMLMAISGTVCEPIENPSGA